MVKDWIPDSGDIIWIDLNPTVGHEQSGKRPALVLTSSSYNAATGLLLACPLTTQVKGYPFEVPVPGGGVVLADQMKCLDWRFRNARLKERAPQAVVKQTQTLLKTLLQL